MGCLFLLGSISVGGGRKRRVGEVGAVVGAVVVKKVGAGLVEMRGGKGLGRGSGLGGIRLRRRMVSTSAFTFRNT